MSNFVPMIVRKETKKRFDTEFLPIFFEANPSMLKLKKVVSTHDFMISRLLDYWSGSDK